MHERARATDANSPIYAPLKARGRDDVPEYYDTSNTVPRMVHERSVSWKATKNASLLPSRTPRGMKNLYLHLHDKPDKPRVQLLTSPADRSPQSKVSIPHVAFAGSEAIGETSLLQRADSRGFCDGPQVQVGVQFSPVCFVSAMAFCHTLTRGAR